MVLNKAPSFKNHGRPAQTMKGRISNYRGSDKTKQGNQLIVLADGVANRESANKLVGKRVQWKSSGGKLHVGVIASPHGNKGALRVRFPKGLPGQALSSEVEIQ